MEVITSHPMPAKHPSPLRQRRISYLHEREYIPDVVTVPFCAHSSFHQRLLILMEVGMQFMYGDMYYYLAA